MKKLNILLILTSLTVFAFQACKTKKNIVDETTVNNYTKQDVENSKEQIPKDTIVPFDSTVLYFTHQDIVVLKKQLSQKTLQDIGIIEGNYYYKGILQSQMRQYAGKATANNYMSILESNSRKTQEATIIKEKADYILNALVTGQDVPNKFGGFTSIKENNKIPLEIKNIYKNHTLFDVIKPDRGYTNKRTYLGSIHKGEIYRAVSLLNIVYNEIKSQHPLTMEERLKIIFRMETGFESKITMTSISEIQNKEEIMRLLTHNLSVNINNIERKFTLGFDYDRFYFLREITNTNEEKIFTIRFISQ